MLRGLIKKGGIEMKKVCWIFAVLLLVGTFLLGAEEEFQGMGLAPVTDEPVIFQGWQYRTDIVEDNVRRYNTELGGHVIYSTIAGDYSAIMENKLIIRAPLDVFYGHIYDAVRYYEGGWIIPAEELPNIDAIKADMYPSILDAFTYDGKLLGLSYFTSVLGVVGVNLKLLEQVGMAFDELPSTWDELYDQLYEIRERGLQHPFLPGWYVEQWGIPWAFILEVMNRGGEIADPETHEPLLTADGPAGDVLRDWKRIWNDGIVEREVLSYKEADFLEAWESGKYLYAPTMLYNIKRHNDPQYSQFAGYCSFIPYKGQPWGMLDAAVYIMSNRPRSKAHTRDVMAFTSWYGYRDHEGKFFVANRWMKESMLFSAYRSVRESPETEATILASVARPEDYAAALELYEHAKYAAGVFNQIWGIEFQTFLREILHEFLLKDLPVEDTIQAMIDRINELNALYYGK